MREEVACRLHCIANGLLGNVLDVIISSMIYAKATRCNMSFSVGFSAGKGWTSVWDERWVLNHLTIEPNAFIHQLRNAPKELPLVCPSKWAMIDTCNHSSTSPVGFPVFGGWGVTFTAFAAFMPPRMDRTRFLDEYAAMARILRFSSTVSGPAHNLSYYQPCLPAETIAVHLRTGRTTYDLRCCPTQRKCKYASTPCNPTNESRFDIPLTRLKHATQWVTAQHRLAHQFVAFDDKTHSSDIAYRGYSALDMLHEHFPQAWYSTSAVRALWSFDDHRLLASAAAIVTYEFSSFSWTAAQMGGVPYYVMNCTEKCHLYSCDHCSSFNAGIRRVGAELRYIPGELRTGQPGDLHDERGRHHGDVHSRHGSARSARNARRVRPIDSVEPKSLPWLLDGCTARSPHESKPAT